MLVAQHDIKYRILRPGCQEIDPISGTLIMADALSGLGMSSLQMAEYRSKGRDRQFAQFQSPVPIDSLLAHLR